MKQVIAHKLLRTVSLTWQALHKQLPSLRGMSGERVDLEGKTDKLFFEKVILSLWYRQSEKTNNGKCDPPSWESSREWKKTIRLPQSHRDDR